MSYECVRPMTIRSDTLPEEQTKHIILRTLDFSPSQKMLDC